MIQHGHIVICSFPFSDFSDMKLRPALVISNERLNSSEDVIVMGISTQEHEQWTGIKIPFSSLLEGSLVQESFVHCHKIHLLSQSLIYKIVAKAGASFMQSVEKRFHDFISET